MRALTVYAAYAAVLALTFSTAHAGQDLLPDITVVQSALYDHDIVTTIAPGRTHLRITNTTPNIGAGKLYLYGVLPDNGDGTQDVMQRIFRDDDSYYDVISGIFVFHYEHDHIHIEGWSMYRLREVLPGDGIGAIVTEGDKTSFCIFDNGIYDSSLPGFVPGGEFSTCGANIQGLSVGWSDTYHKGLPGQEIDVTDVPAGEYWLEAVVDPDNVIVESDESNNTARIKVIIGPPPPNSGDPYEPNNTIEEVDARPVGGPNSPSLGPCAPAKAIAGLKITPSSDVDFFRFYMPATGDSSDEVRIDFDHGVGDLDLELYNSAGEMVAGSYGWVNVEQISLQDVPAGWYYARIFGYNGATAEYALTIDPSENQAPSVVVLNPPAGNTQLVHGIDSYQVLWNASDPDGNSTWVTIFLNTAPVLDGNEVLMPTSLNTPGEYGLFVLNTAEIDIGTYYTYCQVTDGGTTSGTWADGTISVVAQATGIGDTPVPTSRLLPAYPNPFNPTTRLTLELERVSVVSWRIHDVTGALVRTIESGELQAGLHERTWDGRDNEGNAVASGVYLGVVQSPHFRSMQKLVLIK